MPTKKIPGYKREIPFIQDVEDLPQISLPGRIMPLVTLALRPF